MNTMNQLVTVKPYEVDVRQVEIPVPGDEEVLLKVLWGGICGSDLAVYRGKFAFASYPRIPGHEFSAEIVAVGKGVATLKRGMIVTASPYFTCGVCYSCQRGLVNCCTKNQTCGVQRDGVFSQYCVMPAEKLIDGHGLDAQTLAMAEPFCIGYHGVKRAGVKKGERVLVIGAGTIGMMAAISARHFGAEVTLCDVAADKLRLAKDFGITHSLVNTSADAFTEGVTRYTKSCGYDVAIEAVGLPSTVESAIRATAFGGRVVLIGVVGKPQEFSFDLFRNNELTLFGSRNALMSDFSEVLALLHAGTFDLKKLITRVYDYDQAPSAFVDFDKNGATHYKLLLKF